jgi:hypothetical protein
MQQKDQPSEQVTLSGTLNLLYFWAVIQSVCVMPFLRTGMGPRALGWLGPLALVWMWCYGALRPCPLLFPYILAWLVMCVVQKLLKDRSQHSRYLGFPLLCKLPLVKRENAGRLLETVVVAGLAFGLFEVDRKFGEFVSFSAGALFVKLVIDRVLREKRLQDLRDAELAQRDLMHTYRTAR